MKKSSKRGDFFLGNLITAALALSLTPHLALASPEQCAQNFTSSQVKFAVDLPESIGTRELVAGAAGYAGFLERLASPDPSYRRTRSYRVSRYILQVTESSRNTRASVEIGDEETANLINKINLKKSEHLSAIYALPGDSRFIMTTRQARYNELSGSSTDAYVYVIANGKVTFEYRFKKASGKEIYVGLMKNNQVFLELPSGQRLLLTEKNSLWKKLGI